MIRKRLHPAHGRFFPLALMAVGVSITLGACSDAESREDTEGEPATVEDAAASPEGEREPLRALEPGTHLVFEVAEEVSTSSHGPGDSFSLRLTEEVSGSGGLVLPSGTPARGVITAARESEGAEDEAVLAIRIESIRIDGRDRGLNGEVVSADTETEAQDSGARSVGKVATGAAAGALLGQILGGDTRSTVRGAAVGAAAGLGVALTTRDGHARLPEGSIVTIRLDDQLVVN